MNLKVIRVLLTLVLGMCLMTALTPSVATAFTDLTISGDIEFAAGSTYADGLSFGSGDMTVISGGSSSQTTFDESGVSGGVNPLVGSLTTVGDGIGGNASFSGAYDSDYVTGLDLTLNLSNTSPTDSFLISFQLDYANSVDSSGDDAYGEMEFVLDDSNGTEYLASALLSDTLFGNEVNGVATGDLGGGLSDIGMLLFDIYLAPLETLDLYGTYSLWGGVFEDPGTSIASFDAFLSITDVVNETTPIPEPSTVALFGLGLVGLGIMAHRRRKDS